MPACIRNVLIVLALLTLTACAAAGRRPPATSGRSEEIEELATRFSAAVVRASASGWAPGEVEALASLYSEDAILFPPRGEPIKGRDAVRAYWTRSADRRILKHRVAPAHIEVDQVLATEYGYFEMTSAAGEGPPTEGRANYISVWKRDQTGHWRKHLDSWW